MTLVFDAEVLRLVSELTQRATTDQVREALDAEPHVIARFAHDDTASNSKASAPSYVAICEFAAGGDEVRVVATCDLPALLRTTQGHARDATRTRSAELPLSCVLLTRRPITTTTAATTTSPAATSTNATDVTKPLGLRALQIQSLDLAQPLAPLRDLLQNVYEPLLRTTSTNTTTTSNTVGERAARKRERAASEMTRAMTNKDKLALRVQVQDLLSGIRAMDHVLPDVNLLYYIPEDLIQVCEDYPGYELPQLLAVLGERVKDLAYIRRALQIRNRAVPLLTMDALLAGRAEACTAPCLTPSHNYTSKSSSMVSSKNIVADTTAAPVSSASAAITSPHPRWLVQETMYYWQRVLDWMEAVLQQLQGREWRLLHRVLGARVETSYATEYVTYIQTVREYLRYLEGIPERPLALLDTSVAAHESAQFMPLVDALFVALRRPTRYPARLVLVLVDGVVREVARCWARFAAHKAILPPTLASSLSLQAPSNVVKAREDERSSANDDMRGQAEGNETKTKEEGEVMEGDNRMAEVATESAGQMQKSLQVLRASLTTLRAIQQQYTACVRDVTGGLPLTEQQQQPAPLTLSSSQQQQQPQYGGGVMQHPYVNALLERGVTLRNWIERHFLLMRQLRELTGGDDGQQADSTVQRGEDDDEEDTAVQGSGTDEQDREVHRHGSAAMTSVAALVAQLQTAFARALREAATLSVVHEGDNKKSGDAAGEGDVHGTSSKQEEEDAEEDDEDEMCGLWCVTARAERRFARALAEYDAQLDRGDEQLSQYVSSLLTTNTGSSADGDEAALMHGGQAAGQPDMSSEDRLLRVFVDFRFLQLPKVRRVVQSYEGAVTEYLLRRVRRIEERAYSLGLAREAMRRHQASFEVSALVATMMWERQLEQELRECLVQSDYVAKRGWHQLLSLRNVEHLWRLDDRLAAYLDFPMADLVTERLPQESELAGCAYALAYLHLLYGAEAGEWDRGTTLHAARALVQAHDSTALQIATERLRLMTVQRVAEESRAGGGGGTIRNANGNSGGGSSGAAVAGQVRVLRNAMTRRIAEKLRQWVQESGEWLGQLGLIGTDVWDLTNERGGAVVDVTTPLLRVAEDRTAAALAVKETAGGERCARRGNKTSALAARNTGNGVWYSPVHWLVVCFPWRLRTLARDVRYLDGVGLLPQTTNNNNNDDVIVRDRAADSADEDGQAEQLMCLVCHTDDEVQWLRRSIAELRAVVAANEPRVWHAQCLADLLRVFYVCVRGEDAMLATLATEEYVAVNERLVRGATQLRWHEDAAVAIYLQDLSAALEKLVVTAQQVREKSELVYAWLRSLYYTAFHPESIAQRVREMRAVVDFLALRCVQAQAWVRETQLQLDAAVLMQMQYHLHGWTADFLAMRDDERFLQPAMETANFHLRPLRVRMRVAYKAVYLDSDPAAWRTHWVNELSRHLSWVTQLDRLYRDADSRQIVDLTSTNTAPAYETAQNSNSNNNTRKEEDEAQMREGEGQGYTYLLPRLPPAALAEPLRAIEQCIVEARQVARVWRRGQRFLNLDMTVLQQKLGTNLQRWRQALELMQRVTAELMDVTQPNRLLGGIVILAAEAQRELGRKLDQVTQYMISKYQHAQESEMQAVRQQVAQRRSELDGLDVIGDLKDAATFLCAQPALKESIADAELRLTLLHEAEASLLKMGVTLPENWLRAADVREDYNALAELMERKNKALQFRRPFLAERTAAAVADMEAAAREITERLTTLQTEPVIPFPPPPTSTSTTTTVSETANTLAASVVDYDKVARTQRLAHELQDRASELREEARRVRSVQEALGLPTSVSTDTLAQLVHHSEALGEKWDRLSHVVTALRQVGQLRFATLEPQKLQERLQELQATLGSMPQEMQAQEDYKALVAQVQQLLRQRRLMQELHGDAMMPLEQAQRHWLALQQQLHLRWDLERLVVQDIWNSLPTQHALVFSEVLAVAQGEHRIETQVQRITNYWALFQFSLTLYQRRVVLIKGWDAVLEQLADDLATFASMRGSPYFTSAHIVQLATEAERRLDTLRQILELLLEVQKRWVYLDGVFNGNAEVRQQLPQDALQFDRSTRELLQMLPQLRTTVEDGNGTNAEEEEAAAAQTSGAIAEKATAAEAAALPIVTAEFFLQEPRWRPTLERLHGQLVLVQRALASFLDTQRTRFARFFFVGDDDLLEIMASSGNPLALSRHLRKLFTALAAFVPQYSTQALTTSSSPPPEGAAGSGAPQELLLAGFASAEGEQVLFSDDPVAFARRPMYHWLHDVERGMQRTLLAQTRTAYTELMSHASGASAITRQWLTESPYVTQVLCLVVQLWWAQLQEAELTSQGTAGKPHTAAGQLSTVVHAMDVLLGELADEVLRGEGAFLRRHRVEQVITIAVYQRDVSRRLARGGVQDIHDYAWLSVLRLYLVISGQPHTTAAGQTSSVPVATTTTTLADSDESSWVECRMADAVTRHGFEYHGSYERLVQTPLTDRCYLTLMQALQARLGGSPVGPAGTGKTETVKALGMQLGRHVLVFNCDNTFDFVAVSRILLGLCQVGAWGCFDEFNRLEERILSALSQQIQTIQHALRLVRAHDAGPNTDNSSEENTLYRTASETSKVVVNGHAVALHPHVGIFVTMNPSYAGRSHLPANLKQLFHTVTMAVPDGETIAEVMLFTQGFHSAERLSRKVVPLFRLCEEQLSRQAHYDFGLRALKSVLIAAGAQKRAQRSIHGAKDAATSNEDNKQTAAATVGKDEGLSDAVLVEEATLLLQSFLVNIAPRLVPRDLGLFYALLRDFFPEVTLPALDMAGLDGAIAQVCAECGLRPSPAWAEKIAQLLHTQQSRHGVILVGPSGTGKTSAWRVLMHALARLQPGLEIEAYVVEPKVLSKSQLFGSLDLTTREWKDGIFTALLRRIIEAEQAAVPSAEHKASTQENNTSNGVSERRHWIVFDGDVDPAWAENLNSVLDDNKMLTLPNGERLALPANVRILFEVQELRYATPATVSRCGMLCFAAQTLPLQDVLHYAYRRLAAQPIADRRGTRCPPTSLGSSAASLLMPRRTSEEDAEGENTRAVQPVTMRMTRGKQYHQYIVSSMAAANNDNSNEEEGSGETRRAHEDAEQQQQSQQQQHPEAARVQRALLPQWHAAFLPGGLLGRALRLVHGTAEYRTACIMPFSAMQALESVLALLWDAQWRAFAARQARHDRSVRTAAKSEAESEAWWAALGAKALQYAVFWGVCAAMPAAQRLPLVAALFPHPSSASAATTTSEHVSAALTELELDYVSGDWAALRRRVVATELLAEQVGMNDTVIPTTDTLRHESLLAAWLAAGRSAILCGPPGSGKTMSITAVLSQMPEYEVVFLNCSSGTSVETVLRTLEQHCTLENTPRGLVMRPNNPNNSSNSNNNSEERRLLLFCDEVNLPALDAYGTQPIVQLLRQLVEQGGYFRSQDQAWVSLAHVQLVGACNPPSDPGRVPLSARLLRWAPVLLVDFPSPEALETIYGAYTRAILRPLGTSWGGDVAAALSQAMVQTYRRSQAHFTPLQQPHYVYSPRELSRWARALYEAMRSWDGATRAALRVDGLVRLALHEGLRLFGDRLVSAAERQWADATLDRSFAEAFPALPARVFRRPLLYSALVSGTYKECDRDELRRFIEPRLQAFAEEEEETDGGLSGPYTSAKDALGESGGQGGVSLVVFDAVIDHVTRIDRVLRQPLGHVLIAGYSGVGKTVLARLVTWMNGYSPFWLKVHRDYTLANFEDDLRALLRRTGCRRERVCFLFDESNILQPSFLEYMNALLAAGEVPGLFEGEEWTKLMQELRDALTNNAVAATTNTTSSKTAEDASAAHSNTNNNNNNTAAALVAASVSSAATNTSSPATTVTTTTMATVAAGMLPRQGTRTGYIDLRSERDLYDWFLRNIKECLHVVFTINPAAGAMESRTVASPALFNRCTIDWFGDWDRATLRALSLARTAPMNLQPLTDGSNTANTMSANSRGKEETEKAQQEEAALHDALAEALCEIHFITQEVNGALQARQRGTFITPRHFLDCLAHFGRVLREQRAQAWHQRQHLQHGLQKLDDTAAEVAAQQARLREHEAELAERGGAAQEMLERLVRETDMTRHEKATAEELRQQLQAEELRIAEDTRQVEQELAAAEPALREAELALNTVKPENLLELRSYATPPVTVRRVLAAVMALMGERNYEDWEILKSYIRREDFLSSVKAFKPRSITDAARERVLELTKDTQLTVEAARRASRAAGPLLQWVFAQLRFATIFRDVGPMRAKIQHLVQARERKVAALQATEAQIAEKEASLQDLKLRYQSTTEQIAELKSRIALVSAKCARASTVLGQLDDERTRWRHETRALEEQATACVGDCVLAAAFLAYIGFFDEHVRHALLLPRWRACLTRLGIPSRPHLSLVDFLVTPATRRGWEQEGLPTDLLCIENAVLMQRSLRYPLLIDPAETAAAFLRTNYAAQKMSTASFSRPGYLRQLEMAVRFGYPMLLRDAELLDQAVMPLLNREYRHNAGRTITRIGANEVDVASSFTLFLLTREAGFTPPPQLTGVVCLINFSLTPSSLQSQCLHQILLHERPDVDLRRAALLKTQGEYQLRLRELEQRLLTTIAELEGSLLENDKLIDALGAMKSEARAMQGDIDDSAAAMESIARVEQRYAPLAALSSAVFFTLRRLTRLNPLYQYDVSFLFRLLHDALALLPPKATTTTTTTESTTMASSQAENPTSTADEEQPDERERIAWLLHYIFVLTHRRVVRGMFGEDHLVFALRLAQLRSGVREVPCDVRPGEFDWLLHPLTSAAVPAHAAEVDSKGREEEENALMLPLLRTEGGAMQHARELLALPAFAPLQAMLMTSSGQALWYSLLHCGHNKAGSTTTGKEEEDDMEQDGGALLESLLAQLSHVPQPQDATSASLPRIRQAFLLLVLIYYVRREVFVAAAAAFLRLFFAPPTTTSNGVMRETSSTSFFALTATDVATVMPELSEATPLVLLTDGSGSPDRRVEQLAQETRTALAIVAMGSAESTRAAEQGVAAAMQRGTWVLLKNVHLALDYVRDLEKLMHHSRSESAVHRDFRLFLTAERGAQAASLPVSLLASSRLLVYEAAPGVRAALLQSYGALDQQQEEGEQEAQPTTSTSINTSNDDALQRLYLAAAWMHTVIVERVVYSPVGWTVAYEFGEAEFVRTVRAIRTWSPFTTTTASDGAAAAAVPQVAWTALRQLVASIVYGGKVSNVFDQHVLHLLCRRQLQPALLNPTRDYAFVDADMSSEGGAGADLPPVLKPSMQSRAALLAWVSALPERRTPPPWLGLPRRIAQLALARQASEVIERLASIQLAAHDMTSGGSSRHEEGELTSSSTEGVRTLDRMAGQTTAATNTSAAAVHTPATGADTLTVEAWRAPLLQLRDELRGNAFVEQALVQLRADEDGGSFSISAAAAAGDETASRSEHASTAQLDVLPTPPSTPGTDLLTQATTTTQLPPPMVAEAAAPVSVPLELALQREVVMAMQILDQLLADLDDLHEEESKNNNNNSSTRAVPKTAAAAAHVSAMSAARRRAIRAALSQEQVPQEWQALLPGYTAANNSSSATISTSSHTTTIASSSSSSSSLLAPWLAALQARVRHLLALLEAGDQSPDVQLGRLFFPAAFLSAAKQQYGRETGVPLEQLQPHITLLPDETREEQKAAAAAAGGGGTRERRTDNVQQTAEAESSVAVLHLRGMVLEFASLDADGQATLHAQTSPSAEKTVREECLAAPVSTPVRVRWDWAVQATASDTNERRDREVLGEEWLRPFVDTHGVRRLPLPLYLTDVRDQMLGIVAVPIAATEETDRWYERGVCLVARTSE